jgi:hypothetical protein
MPRRDKKPKQTDNSLLDLYAGYVEPGEYIYYGSSNAPDDLPSGGEDCRGLVLAASTMSSTSLPNIPPAIYPEGTVYLIRYFRSYPRSTTPWKVDDVLYWSDQGGHVWTIHSKDSPDHHSTIMSSTDMAGLITDLKLPSESKGTLKDYRIPGAYLSFEEPFTDENEK